jgi:hypothetical protein
VRLGSTPQGRRSLRSAIKADMAARTDAQMHDFESRMAAGTEPQPIENQRERNRPRRGTRVTHRSGESSGDHDA